MGGKAPGGRLSCRVAGAVVMGLAPTENCANALPNAPGRLRPYRPYRLQYGQYIAATDPVDLHIADDRKGVELQRSPPVHRVLAVAPAWQVRVVDLLRSFPKGRDIGPLAFGQRITPGGDKSFVGEGERASLRQADGRVAAETQLPPASVDHDPLHP